ncbi:hypothetical protein [Streptomyces sp. NBC_00059]|uniref:hypothetical protein n=1 Tax=Streptomyces sp. NBC_00059 TaxID=2975635 RepID=UPI00225B50D3|nr:hypothetical protein [Streptomyces sp. NBC_00059]MCX5417680.1 hypothetical protein [Streptomyces sp. NBC_00059]
MVRQVAGDLHQPVRRSFIEAGFAALAPRRPCGDQELHQLREQPLLRGGDLCQDGGDVLVGLGGTGALGESVELAAGSLPVAVGSGQGVQGGVETDAVPGEKQGVGCGRGAMALVLDRHVVREAVLVAAGPRG